MSLPVPQKMQTNRKKTVPRMSVPVKIRVAAESIQRQSWATSVREAIVRGNDPMTENLSQDTKILKSPVTRTVRTGSVLADAASAAVFFEKSCVYFGHSDESRRSSIRKMANGAMGMVAAAVDTAAAAISACANIRHLPFEEWR
jgi:hypothetical protein